MCADCGYIYDPDPEAPFEDLPGFWKCPQCAGPRRRFVKKVSATARTTRHPPTKSGACSPPLLMRAYRPALCWVSSTIPRWPSSSSEASPPSPTSCTWPSLRKLVTRLPRLAVRAGWRVFVHVHVSAVVPLRWSRVWAMVQGGSSGPRFLAMPKGTGKRIDLKRVGCTTLPHYHYIKKCVCVRVWNVECVCVASACACGVSCESRVSRIIPSAVCGGTRAPGPVATHTQQINIKQAKVLHPASRAKHGGQG